MDPVQLRALIEAISAKPDTFNWVQGAMALGATLVSVTGVVVGMRAAIASLSAQLKEQGRDIKELAAQIQGMAKELAVLKYASGIESTISEKE